MHDTRGSEFSLLMYGLFACFLIYFFNVTHSLHFCSCLLETENTHTIATQIQHLMPAPVAAAYFHDEILREQRQSQNDPTNTATTIEYPRVTVVASHEGQVGRASHFRSALQRLSGGQSIELAVLSKNKLLPGETHYTPTLVGQVKGRRCILVDDICNTGTTLVSNIQVRQG